MSKQVRLYRLMNEIGVRPGQTGRELALKFKCTERTILRDIKELEGMGQIIISHDGYRYCNKPYLHPMGLTRDEIVALILAQNIALPHLDEEAATALSHAVNKVRITIPEKEKRIAQQVEKNTAVIASPTTEADIAATLLTCPQIMIQLALDFSRCGRVPRLDRTPLGSCS